MSEKQRALVYEARDIVAALYIDRAGDLERLVKALHVKVIIDEDRVEVTGLLPFGVREGDRRSRG